VFFTTDFENQDAISLKIKKKIISQYF
jgi:hypothetical protein